jgi:hypothetical protein
MNVEVQSMKWSCDTGQGVSFRVIVFIHLVQSRTYSDVKYVGMQNVHRSPSSNSPVNLSRLLAGSLLASPQRSSLQPSDLLLKR